MSWGGSDQDRRLAGVIRIGTVMALDPATARARVSFGGESESDWLPFPSARAGRTRVWSPPEVGEQVMVAAPGGESNQALIVASVFQDAFPAPSADGASYEIHLGPSRIVMTEAAITIHSNGSEIVLDAAGIRATAPRIDLN